MQTIIFFDIDYTLWDTRKYRQLFYQTIQEKLHIVDENFEEKLEKLYRQYMDSRGNFYPQEFAQIIVEHFHKEEFATQIVDCILDPLHFQKALYPDTKQTLEELYKEGLLLGIFSRGVDGFQELKIASIRDYLANEHTYIFEEKDKKLSEVLADYSDYNIYLVDDLPKILKLAKEINSSVHTVWIANGYIERNKKETPNFVPDYSIKKLEELLSIVKKA